ncbi:thiamine pyrophosphate-dependent dehydrogenase E1 component subunit alpha [Streptomyces albipurpureus]|uniref:Thiamine pyrophosphate-dependent dehydrogenase E1 component subunit alpha n=1 Tax=Streptomyces albipurpureus TaxID=2897419 RepID=A0ABT0UES7_9ACTN|nr:thiamine pyrophosphate-dependent dehydrogenase E1 component subunit alpha [Streptomyces sp. CWNU-1]MCM2386819.1 thiamine pyrophosphate-dependent dehydrogenase E1 component subunit alpha [Streptomyces sp. CWNU-1]
MSIDSLHTPEATPKEVSKETAIALYRTMSTARKFEQRVHDLFLKDLVKGPTHLGIGQEAIAAGVAAAMREDDYSFITHRGHSHLVARGTPLAPLMAELLGRDSGLMRGKGGSTHLIDAERGVLGSYAIVGAQLVIANGAAWSAQYRDSGQVTVCVFGDGATNTGAFHEALNLAVIWNLPVVFLCENNLYSRYTRVDSVTAVDNPAADRACAYGLASTVIDGNDPDEVHLTVATAIELARTGGGPALIEAITFSHGGHSGADPAGYRDPGEVRAWKDLDPLVTYRARLKSRGITDEVLNGIDAEIVAQIDAATEEAMAGDWPAVSRLYTNVWSDGGHAWRN